MTNDISQQYEATTEWLFTQLPVFQRTGASAYKPGLDTALRLSSMFGDPHKRLRTIHVAGTNGKGSTSSTLAAILQSAGLRTGLYTSPHLVDFRERIRVDGCMISREEVVDFIDRYRRMSESCGADMAPSFFELTTIMAFEYFARRSVDVAVIEVGLGGRLDTTNIISPDLSVITNISLDHTALLGDTPGAIAREKAGIIKPGVPVVIGEASGEVRLVFDSVAAEAGAPAVYASDYAPISQWRDAGSEYVYLTRNHGTVRGELRGECQPLNAATVLTAVDVLNSRCGYALSDDAIRRGMCSVGRTTGLTGRWTRLRDIPEVICDTGHNIGGWQHIAADLRREKAHKIMVLGFVNDKDVSAILDTIAAIPDTEVICTRASVPRALESGELCRQALMRGIDASSAEPVGAAYEEALRRASAWPDAKAMVFVGGSNFVVGDLLAHLDK